MSQPATTIHWFRKGLRLHDNPALLASLEKNDSGSHYQLRPVFTHDPNIFKKHMRVGGIRWRFLIQSLEDLDRSLRNLGSRLYVIRGDPVETFKRIFKEWNVKRLTFEGDVDPYSVTRDLAVTKLAQDCGVEVITKWSLTIYNPQVIIAKNLGKPPLTMQKWISVAESLPAPPRPLEAPSSIPVEARAPLDEGKHLLFDLREQGVDPDSLGPCLFPGGESEALARMEKHLARKDYICKFEKPNTSPNSLEPSTTVLSPYFKFGCLSSRLFYCKLKEVYNGRKHSQPPVSLMGQLYWREFYFTAAAGTPNFDKMVGNPVCVQVPWDKNEKYLQAWTDGLTGYPWIDAIMRQLRQEGWIHHLARHAVACFLTRGDLWQSWEEGQKVFEELLIDADWSLNAGNWLWLSASAFFSQFFRVYSPVAFGKKTDKLGEYVRKYVPEVRKLPPEYVYEPWKAPMSVQKQAGCVVGTDYPRRIVIHEDVHKINIQRMSAAYKQTKADKSNAEKSQSKRSSEEKSESTSKKQKTKNKTIKEFVKKK